MRKMNKHAVLNMLPVAGLVVIILFALLMIGTYINGTIGDQLIGTYPATVTQRSALQNMTVNTLENLTTDYDSTVEIVSVAAIITVITIPLMAVIAIKRLI
jgi:hypothetical protein